MPAQLVAELGQAAPPILLLPDGASAAFGRNHDNNQLVLHDRHVSRYHGSISGRNGRFFLRDLASVNGTRIDGRKIQCETPLRDGQAIRAGSVVLRFSHLPDPAGFVRPPFALEPAWLSANDRAVTRLAETILDENSWDLLPVLADALEDAGCDDADLLGHCRSGGHHKAACWVLDLIVPRPRTSVADADGDSTVMKLLPWEQESG